MSNPDNIPGPLTPEEYEQLPRRVEVRESCERYAKAVAAWAWNDPPGSQWPEFGEKRVHETT